MTGRGIDQALPRPADPALFERWIRDAREYVVLAEEASGPLSRPLGFDHIWGDALDELAGAAPHARIVNLETSVTSRGRPWPRKSVHYRMSPENAPCLAAAGLDVCALANNHVLDWGLEGLEDTLRALDAAGIGRAGAGRDLGEASAPRTLELPGGGRLLVFSMAHPSSGVPLSWAASARRPGVHLVEELSENAALRLARHIGVFARAGDLVVASIHWGENWGFAIPPEQAVFARTLISSRAVHVVHGHSSHHVKGIEVFGGRLILYGCGDLIDDYEGISGYERYRSELGLLYFAELDPTSGELLGLRMTPTRTRRLRLERAGGDDVDWILRILEREGAALGTGVALASDGRLDLTWRT